MTFEIISVRHMLRLWSDGGFEFSIGETIRDGHSPVRASDIPVLGRASHT